MLTHNNALPPLLCRAPFEPGESLFSLLVRLAEFNLYESPAILNRLCVADLPDTQAGHPIHTATFERLSNLTLLTPSQLYMGTLHRFAPVLIPPDVEMPTLTLIGGITMPQLSQTGQRRQTHPTSATQFCPCCLGESAYHRLIWMARAATICLHHQCYLLDSCPDCHQRLHIRDIVQRQCHRCEADLSLVAGVGINHDPFGLLVQQVIQAWLTGTKTSLTTQWGLPKHPPAALFWVLEGIRSTMMKTEPDWKYLRHANRVQQDQALPAGTAHRFYVTAFKALLNWPEEFYEFLQAYRGRDGETLCRGLHVDFRHLYTSWLQKRWKSPAFQFVQEAFNQFLVDHYPRSNTVAQSARYRYNSTLAQKFTYIPVAEAARLFGRSSIYVQSLIQSGILTAYPSQDYARPQPFVEREAVLAFRRQTQFISLKNAAQKLAISPSMVLALGKLSLLEAECDPKTEHWLVRERSIAKLILAVAEYVPDAVLHPPSGHVVDLISAVKTLSRFGVSQAHLIQRVVQGKLPAYCYLVYPTELGKLFFVEDDIEDWRQELCRTTNVEARH